MVRKSVLLPLLSAAVLLAAIGFGLVVVPLAFEVPCPEQPEEGASSPAPSPGSGCGGEEVAAACVCMRVSCATVHAVCFFAGVLTGIACDLCYGWFADGDEEAEADGAAKKAGYVAIAGGNLEVAATGDGGSIIIGTSEDQGPARERACNYASTSSYGTAA